MRSLTKLELILVTVAVAVLALLYAYRAPVDEKYCRADEDCACGVNINTGDCFYGNKNFVNVSQQCPDFCNGIAANLVIRCIGNACMQRRE